MIDVEDTCSECARLPCLPVRRVDASPDALQSFSLDDVGHTAHGFASSKPSKHPQRPAARSTLGVGAVFRNANDGGDLREWLPGERHMTGYIDCAVLGTVIVKPQLKRSAKGTAYARVLLVVGDDAHGKQFTWVTCFGEDAQRVAPLLRKGASRSK